MKNIQSQPASEENPNDIRPIGQVEKVDIDGKSQIRIRFSEIFRNPQIFYEANLDLDDE